jgi:hypothetical protein
MREKPFIVQVNRRKPERVYGVVVRRASIGPAERAPIEYVFGPNWSSDVWLRTGDHHTGLSIEARYGPHGLGVRLHTFVGMPRLTVPRSDEAKPGWYETRDLELCVYDDTTAARAFRERYFKTGLDASD